MKRITISFIGIFALLFVGSSSFAVQIDIFGTGVDDSGTLTGLVTADTHYSLIDPVGDSATAYAAGDGHPNWINATSTAQWITPTGNGVDWVATGSWIYSIDFDLTGFDSSTAIIEGLWASDNNSSISLNGVSTGLTNPGFASLLNFSLDPSYLESGINTLTFSVNNTYNGRNNPSGLIVDITTATANAVTPAPVPEPSTILLLGSGLLGLGWYGRKRKKA